MMAFFMERKCLVNYFIPVSMSSIFSRDFSTDVFVSRLSFYTTKERLREIFTPFGTVTKARLVVDESTQRPKGFGFVTYESEEDALKAVKGLNCRIIDGRLIFVEIAKSASHSDNSS